MEILRCLQDVQGQLGEMREFVEIQLSVHRDLLDRVVTHGFAAEHSVAVSAKFAKGPEALKTIQEDLEVDETETVGTTDTIETPPSKAQDVTILESPSNAPNPGSYAQAQLQLQNLQARHLRVTTKAVHSEFQKRNWRSCIKQIIFSPLFSLAITLLILLNVVLLGVEVDVSASLDLDEVPSWFATVNAIIVTVFVIEMILKIFVLGCREFWCGEEAGWNCFDFAIVSASVLDLAVDIIASLLSSSLDTGASTAHEIYPSCTGHSWHSGGANLPLHHSPPNFGFVHHQYHELFVLDSSSLDSCFLPLFSSDHSDGVGSLSALGC